MKVYNDNYLLLESNKVHVYPSAYRGYTEADDEIVAIDEEANLNTEYNIINTQTAVYRRSYIIEYSPATEGVGVTTLRTAINGYYFVFKFSSTDLEAISNKLTENETMSAYIYTKNVQLLGSETEKTYILSPFGLSGTNLDAKDTDDDTPYFYGLLFGKSTPIISSGLVYSLELFTKTADGLQVVENSKLNSDAGLLHEDTITVNNPADGKIKYKYIALENDRYVTAEKELSVVNTKGSDGDVNKYLNEQGNFTTVANYTEGAGINFDTDETDTSKTKISVRTGYTENDKNYAVQVDDDNTGLYVNVPWINYAAGTNLALNNDTNTFAVIAEPIFTKVTANTFDANSDIRLKENIVEYKCDKSILDLPIYKYDYICGPKNQIGCIAQELREICPELVDEDKYGMLSIQESKLVYLLLEEVKELKKKVEELGGK